VDIPTVEQVSSENRADDDDEPDDDKHVERFPPLLLSLSL
jgi:hypothetical protein